ncbi:uncharacterized protein LAESUDRAFT_759243 [Laetiporus sulphureus 93-53]|uniref:Uncharacterized protein n=1 Tax=Laetiporus sulphureus 93-53 TaxID=1314785 RepID=A0A165B1Z1_9APHY|nr:uncharacterized protein LAESUDRAFT_764947 [Laetiporus sulphureus 93-53]XP_040764132.1 uncharacterized protein LAESUDRAFT_759243 [Laetiporus sulphureus 93-53]KZT00079.1 hypothetical protein LAESUDRAFT_764947 [Laetiporus sulphureus 93-53]KZT06392.1 hypothetical protein LAESUDRAFT_759243 [Laetiporus sulphureus 93-53]
MSSSPPPGIFSFYFSDFKELPDQAKAWLTTLDNIIMDVPALDTLKKVWHHWVDMFVLTLTELRICSPFIATPVFGIMASMLDWLMFHSWPKFDLWLAAAIGHTDLAAFHSASTKASFMELHTKMTGIVEMVD